MNEQRTTPLERLSADATQGEWHLYAVRNTVQISDGPEPTNRAAIVHWAGFDSGDRTNREKLANARFITELVNAYRSGKLVSSETTQKNAAPQEPNKQQVGGGTAGWRDTDAEPAVAALSHDKLQNTPRLFPIMRGPSVPWEVMAPHEHQAKRNHSQTLQRLAERGGLGTGEAWCVVNGLDLDFFDKAKWAECEKKWCEFAERINLHYDELERLRAEQSATTPLQLIVAEVERARAKHPTWPANDTLFAAAIVAEESGELMRAAVQFKGEGGSLAACDKEAIQTAAVAIRFLERR